MESSAQDSREAVAARLVQLREALGLDKQTFAQKARIGKQTYGPFELAQRDLTLNAAKKLRATYGVPLDWLYFGNRAALPHNLATVL